ncbi:hypothetical protein Lal_00040454 [Lupinus albus]|nr:hypothetical protein Lal_00040454 [Lupinus albus]
MWFSPMKMATINVRGLGGAAKKCVVLISTGYSNPPLENMVDIGKNDVFQKTASRNGKGFLGVIGNHLASRELCYVINVYSPCNYKEKRHVWLELGEWKNESSCNMWCIASDFNSVKSSEERKGRKSHERLKEMHDFNCFINKLDLIDLPLVGKRFIWIKGDDKTMSRLDRFLIISD